MDLERLNPILELAGTAEPEDYARFDIDGNYLPNTSKRTRFLPGLGGEAGTNKFIPVETRNGKRSGKNKIISAITFKPGYKPGLINADITKGTRFVDFVGRRINSTLDLVNLTPKEAYALQENIKNNPKILDEFYDQALLRDKGMRSTTVHVRPEKVKEFLAKFLDTSNLNLQPGQQIKIFDDPVQRAATVARRKETHEVLQKLLKFRNLRNLGLLAAGAGATGALGSLWDDKDNALSSGLSTALGAAAVPTGLATLGGAKLHRLMTRKPLYGLAAGILGGLGGFAGNKAVQDILTSNDN